MTKRTTEGELGYLGKLVSQMYVKKAEAMLKMIEEGMNADDVIDHKAVQAIGKWVTDNGVYAAPDAADEASPLAARLQEIRNRNTKRVINFQDEA